MLAAAGSPCSAPCSSRATGSVRSRPPRALSASQGICRGGAPLLENGHAEPRGRRRDLSRPTGRVRADDRRRHGLLAVGISYSSRRRVEHVGEYYALLATCGGGMAFLVSASNLMTLFLGLEWFSVWLYVLCAMDLDSVPSLEAGLKYLIVGSFGSGVLLFGSALIYGAGRARSSRR